MKSGIGMPRGAWPLVLAAGSLLCVACAKPVSRDKGPSETKNGTAAVRNQEFQPAGSRHSPALLVGVGQFVDLRRENNSTFDVPALPAESKVINETDLGPLVSGALQNELSKSGYRAVHYSDAIPDTVDYAVTGEVPKLTLEEIVIRLEVKRDGIGLLDRDYSGTITGLSNIWAPPSRNQLQAALQKTYQDLARRIIRDIQTVLK